MDSHQTNGQNTPFKAILWADLPKSARPRTPSHRRTNTASNDRRRPAKSAPISLPKTRIHHTPSEIQLVSDTLHAECKDVAMYSRLLVGMLHQVQDRGDVDNVHPLVRKSMLGIFRTKEACDRELEHKRTHYGHDECSWDASFIPNDYEQEQHNGKTDDDSGWDMYSPIDEETELSFIASSSLSGKSSKDSSFTSLHADVIFGGVEDDCIFSLEM